MSRPDLSPNLPASEFRRYYWLKEELLAFCRTQHLPTAGSKQTISDQIAAFLSSGTRPAQISRAPRFAAAMPTELTRATIITPGFRCSQQLRAFFVAELGSHFHFDGVMRALIKNGVGMSLGDALTVWQAARQQPPSESEIAPQFEYNRHMRAFFKAHPGATRQEAVAAWNEQKARPKP